jgi:hypothetical protein
MRPPNRPEWLRPEFRAVNMLNTFILQSPL